MQTTVLFVETEGEILKSLPQLHDNWQSIRVNTSEAALEIISQRQIALIVAHFGSAHKACKDFFSDVNTRVSSAIQFVLLSDNNNDELGKSMDYSHQCFSAQCPPDEIIKAINRGLSVWQRTRANPQLEGLLKKLNQLPTPPALYFDLRDELDSPNYSVGNVAKIIARDQALSARLLRVVNSGFYAVPRSIADLSQAVSLLGTDIVLGLVLSAHLFDSLPLPGMNLDDLWKHTMTVSSSAKHIAKQLGADFATVNLCGVAGLLHDLGGLVLLANLPAQYHSLIRQAKGDETLLVELEQQEFGVAHPEIGALVMELWNMPEAMIEAVAGHHQRFQQQQSISVKALLLGEWLVNEYALHEGVYDEGKLKTKQPDEISGKLEQWWGVCADMAAL